MEKLSVIIPVYNPEIVLLERCINSVINQTYKNIEIIIIDDGSKKEVFKSCKSLAKRDNRIVLNRQNNKGVSAARNLGIELSTGKYITFIDSDDYVDINFLEKMYLVACENSSDIVFTSHNKNFSKKVKPKRIYNTHKKILIISENIKEFSQYNLDLIGNVWAKLYKKECIGNIRFDTTVFLGEDFLFNLQIFNDDMKYSYINEYLYQYTVNESSSMRKFNENTLNLYENTLKKISNILETNCNEAKREVSYLFVCTVYRVIITNYFFNSKNKEKFKNKVNQIKELRFSKTYSNSIDCANLSKLKVTRKIPIVLARRNHFLLLGILSKLYSM